jgi:hypothetical protein
MGNVTSDLLIWTPDQDDLGDPDIYLATMAQSLEDGTGERLRKQEQFIGCNLGVSAFTADGTIKQVPFANINSWNYNLGMTVSGGAVTVPVDGIYTVQVNANYLGATTTPGRINTYLYLGGGSVQFSSTYGNTATSRYSNASIATSLKLTAGNVLSVKAASYDANSNLQGGGGSSFSVVLTKPL